MIATNKTRDIEAVWSGQPTLEGAGVRLKRIFGYSQLPALDPFLLLDHFGSNDPADYLAGFPWHPHRGIETVTYLIEGEVRHGDSLGNKGAIGAGDVQWMTAGSGIIHEEMPQRSEQALRGFQLWVNLPARAKMTAPRYRGLAGGDIPEISFSGARVKIVSGTLAGTEGPLTDIVMSPTYLDISLPPDTAFTMPVDSKHTVGAYVFEGQGYFGPQRDHPVSEGQFVLLTGGDAISANTGEDKLRFLLITGEPLREPIAWRGPIVMNTQDELYQAFEEYRNGTFIKDR